MKYHTHILEQGNWKIYPEFIAHFICNRLFTKKSLTKFSHTVFSAIIIGSVMISGFYLFLQQLAEYGWG